MGTDDFTVEVLPCLKTDRTRYETGVVNFVPDHVSVPGIQDLLTRVLSHTSTDTHGCTVTDTSAH